MPKISNLPAQIAEEMFTPMDEIEYSDQELRKFDEEMEKYRITKTLSSGETVSYLSWENYLVDQKAVSPQGAIYIKPFEKNGEWGYDHHLNRYRVLMNKIRQWQNYRERRAEAKKHELADYDKMAAIKQVEPLPEELENW